MYKKRLLLIILLLISNVTLGLDTSYKYTILEGSNVPDDVPIFDENNERHFMEEYEGKTILLVFWASWCAQCTNEMPSLDILAKDFRKLDFKILPISIDYTGIETAKEFYKKYDLRHLEILHDYKNALFGEMEITALPTSIIIDKDGKLIGKFTGDVAWHDEKVRSILLDNIPNNPSIPKNTYKKISLDQKVKSNNPSLRGIEPKQEAKADEAATQKRSDLVDHKPSIPASPEPHEDNDPAATQDKDKSQTKKDKNNAKKTN